MYLRNVKQILRAADSSFDERRYGFGGLMDLLRACQKESLIRLERDRRGGLRVFQGAALQRASAPPILDVENEIIDAQPGESIEAPATTPHEETPLEPIPIDTTAELLGRAKPRRPRLRLATSAAAESARAPRKTAARKPASTPKRTRAKKSATHGADTPK
jgi:hypothetical protein